MKKYIEQIFYEGLGRSIYYPLEDKIKKLNNKKIKKFLIKALKIVYFILAFILAFILFYIRL